MTKRLYKIDFVSQTLTISKDFETEMLKSNSKYYALYKQLLNDFPNFTVRRFTHCSPSHSNIYKNLTYSNMEKYIKAFDNADEILEMFEKAKELSKAQKSRYAFVKNWFLQQFPDYKKFPSIVDGKLTVIPFIPKAEDDMKEAS